MPISPSESERLAARVKLAYASFALMRRFHLLRQKAGFDPNQPRVPAGNSDGGQWTGGGGAGSMASTGRGSNPAPGGGGKKPRRPAGTPSRVVRDTSGLQAWESYSEIRRPDGSLAGRAIRMRDGSRILASVQDQAGVSETRHIVTLKNGTSFLFETQDGVQKVHDAKGRLLLHSVWSGDGPVLQPVIQQVSPLTPDPRALNQAGNVLYNWLSSRNSPEQRACLAFKARGYEGTAKELLYSGLLSRSEVGGACRRLADVQRMTDEATRHAGSRNAYKNNGAFGTAVHVTLRRMIDTLNDPELSAEVSLMKSLDDPFALKGSIRIDVIEDKGGGPVCIYDIKTGKDGLSFKRTLEMAERIVRNGFGSRTIIVTEIRPFE